MTEETTTVMIATTEMPATTTTMTTQPEELDPDELRAMFDLATLDAAASNEERK